jgi:hypothetical protein
MGYSAIAAMQPSKLLLIRTLRLQLLHTMNMMGRIYNADQMLVKSISDKNELGRLKEFSLGGRLI